MERIMRAKGFYPCLVLSVHKIGARVYEHSSVMSHNRHISASTSKMTSETGGPRQRHQCRGGRCLNGAAPVARCRAGAGDVARGGVCTANIARCRLGAGGLLELCGCCCSWWWWPCFSDETETQGIR